MNHLLLFSYSVTFVVLMVSSKSGADGDDPPGDAVDDWALQLSVG